MLKMTFGERTISTERRAFIMGIVNATPDSFFSKSRGGVNKAFELLDQGADIIDIGGESTRPGFTQVSKEEEIKRIVPVIKALRKKSDVVISVDTRKKEVMKAAYEEGADILNDVSSFESDPALADYAAEKNLSVILMHGYNKSENHESSENITKEVSDYLLERANFAIAHGIKKEKIILDPGIGFGKTNEENISLIKDTEKLCSSGYPLLMALSRKRVIGNMTGRDVEERLTGTVTADLISVIKGAKILRVHDVKETLDSLNVMKYLL